MQCVGVVVIGRNEGPRLRDCLESLRGYKVVYVDSGSTDGSVTLARAMGADVVELDMREPFSAARARNEGVKQLKNLLPDLEYIQFVDGDCTVSEHWIESALSFMQEHSEYAVVCGRRRERSPDASVYNRLCDIEWNTPVGEALACGGDALVRVAAMEQCGLYNARIIAGEEPELCSRLRHAGWRIWRQDAEMTAHDARIMHFSQWWRRSKRTGYGASMCAAESGLPDFRRLCRSAVIWGILIPIVILASAPFTFGLSLLLSIAYVLQFARIFSTKLRAGLPRRDARLYAFYCVAAKFPQAQGVVRFWFGRMCSKPSRIIEYKNTASHSVSA